MKYKELDKNKGFTLVELLVVVSIIAILSVIGLTIFTSAQKNARDARRKADIDAIANAIETTRTPGTVYYTSLPTNFSSGAVPMDNNNSASQTNYCIKTSTGATVPALPTAMNATGNCPAEPTTAVTGESSWTVIPATGLSSQSTTTTGPFYFAAPATSSPTITWEICARLESNTFYCKQNAQ